MKKTFETVSEVVDNEDNNPVDLDHALSVAGIGWYNIRYSLALAMFLISAIVEPIGYSYVLPAAKCDLQMTEAQRGFIGSIPYIGVVLTSFPWGYLVDTRGRKKMIIYSSLAAGFLGILAAFMPNLISFTIFKFLSALCIACPAAVPYSFVGEILPSRYRDLTLSITNALQITGSALVPMLAWAILPFDFRVDFGLYEFRSWRLLTIVYSSFFILSAILMSFGPESPKYLISQGKHDESLQVLQMIYSGNKRKPASQYPVKRLKIPESQEAATSFVKSLLQQSVPLLRTPYLKWLILNGTIFFGIFANLNGLSMWLPDILNRVFTGESADMTACDVIKQRLNQTSNESAECDDSIDEMTFMINTIAILCCALIAVGISTSVKLIGKKALLVLIHVIIGTFCILINVVTQDILFAILLSSVPMTGLAIGPINAYAVEIFPTHLRGMAISLTMMVGRCGSIVGGNVAGILINAYCELTFYIFGGILVLNSLLSFLYPRSKIEPKSKKIMTHL